MNPSLKTAVSNRGAAPDEFLTEIIAWAKTADDSIFAPNDVYDCYSLMEPVLGPWQGILHRKAAMLELMRVHGGMESSWNWQEGVDTTNEASMSNINREETGLWQVSFDSLNLDADWSLHGCIGKYMDGGFDPKVFIPAMKSCYPFACEYYARLVRISIEWAGPLISIQGNPPAVLKWLSRSAVNAFEACLTN